jgi:hypothetical protein
MFHVRWTALGLLVLAAGCGKKLDQGFDWAPNQTQKYGKLQVTLKRIALLPRDSAFLNSEPTGMSDVTIDEGKGYYAACEFTATYDGKPLWALPPGQLVSIGPTEILYGKAPVMTHPLTLVDKIPANVKQGTRDGYYAMGFAVASSLTKEGQVFSVQFAVTLKPNSRLTVAFTGLKPPPESKKQ